MTAAGDRRNEDATALAAAFAAGSTDPVEAMHAALERLERVNPQLNAVIHPRPESALAEAAVASRRWARRRAQAGAGSTRRPARRLGRRSARRPADRPDARPAASPPDGPLFDQGSGPARPTPARPDGVPLDNPGFEPGFEPGLEGLCFDGVPMAVKDLGCEQEGEPYHAGARFLAESHWRATADSHLYQQMRAAGLISVGRTNTPEFGTTITTEPAVYGPTANPWNLRRSAGGSSGGSAAAVAAGIVPIAHGNDGGGSIRVPAAACGLVGLKPTRGRVSTAPRLGEHRGGLAVDGMLTRTVRDAARCLDIISRPAPGDPYSAPPLAPGESFASALTESPPPLRIAVSLGPLSRPSSPALPDSTKAGSARAAPSGGANAVRDGAEAAAKLLEALGHRIEPDTAPDGWYSDELSDHLSVVRMVSMAADVAAWEQQLGREITEADIEPANWWSAQMGASLPAWLYVQAQEELAGWRRRAMSFWRPSPGDDRGRLSHSGRRGHERYRAHAAHADHDGSDFHDGFDLLLTPVLADVTPTLGRLSDPVEGARRIASLAAFVNQANATGQPAISLPMALDCDGLPLGVQLHAAHGNERLLLSVAQQIADAGGLIPLADLPHSVL